MNESLWEEDFKVEEAQRTPEEIIKEQCGYLNKKLNNQVKAMISMYQRSSFDNWLKREEGELGEVGEQNDFCYEFYITSPRTPNYKYRAFIIEYGIKLYPAHFQIDEGLIKDLKPTEDIPVHNEEELKDFLKEIFNSEKMRNVISNLLRMNKDY